MPVCRVPIRSGIQSLPFSLHATQSNVGTHMEFLKVCLDDGRYWMYTDHNTPIIESGDLTTFVLDFVRFLEVMDVHSYTIQCVRWMDYPYERAPKGIVRFGMIMPSGTIIPSASLPHPEN